ncbi:MAG: creatininase family protein [Myxococcales bacterium]|nr:creatininase family protein [Myxococcales bacterium]
MIRLLDLPHTEARRRLSEGAVAWITANPIEYHGPHLPLDTDRLQSLGWIEDLHTALEEPGEPLLCADLPLGVEPAPGPGSQPVSYAHLREAVARAARSAVELGARRIVVVTFHGSPLHNLALHDVVVDLRRRGIAACAPFQDVVRLLLEPLDLERARRTVAHLGQQDAERVLADLGWDFHAGFFETSLMLHWAPASVSPRHVELPPCPAVPRSRRVGALGRLARALGAAGTAAELEFAAVALGWQSLRPFPGYTGHPALASAGAGAEFAELVVERTAPRVRQALAGEPIGGPPLAWIGPLTAWGRLSSAPTTPRVVELPR